MNADVAYRTAAAAVDSERRHAETCLVCEAMLVPSHLAGLRKCAQCGFVSAAADLDPDALAALYGEDYFHGSEYFDYVEERDSLRLNFRGRMATLEALAGGLAGKSILEIGCAYGFFMEFAAERGMIARGFDISGDAVRYARAELHVDAVQGDYLALDCRAADAIVMWDTLEHLSRPDLFIEKAARDLKPGGLLAITTGDIGSINARMRGGAWRMIHPPTHLHYFSVKTLTRLVARNGLDVVHVSHPGVSRRLHSILYMVFARRLQSPRACALLSRLLPDIAVTLNLFDIMFIVARKVRHPLEESASWK